MSYESEIVAEAVWLHRVENALALEVELLFSRELRLALPATETGWIAFQVRTFGRLESLYQKLAPAVETAVAAIGERAVSRMLTVMERAAKKTAAVAGIARERTREIVHRDAIEGFSVPQWHEYNKRRFRERLTRALSESRRDRFSLQETRDYIGKKAFEPLLRGEQSLARTAASNVANAAIWEAAEASGLARGYRLKVTLDGRTSKICLRYSTTPGRIYPFAPSSPRPPFHFRCRTLIMPVVKGREREDIPEDGDKWFRSLSQKEQDDVLGKRRASLFRRGKIGLAELVRADHSIITLPELRGVAALSGGNL